MERVYGNAMGPDRAVEERNSWAGQRQPLLQPTGWEATSATPSLRQQELDQSRDSYTFGRAIPSSQDALLSEEQPPLPPDSEEPVPPLPPEDEPPPPLPSEDTTAQASALPSQESSHVSWSPRAQHSSSVPPWQTQQASLNPWQPAGSVTAKVPVPGPQPSARTKQQPPQGSFVPPGVPVAPPEAFPQHQGMYSAWMPSWQYTEMNSYSHQPYSGPGQSAYPPHPDYQTPHGSHFESYNVYGQPSSNLQAGSVDGPSLPWDGHHFQPAHEVPWAQPTAAAPAAQPDPPAPALPTVATKNEVDAEDIFLRPGRDKRPRKLAVILRGLPGSGKSHIAKKLREVEIENGGEAPRIHAIDDYFVTEVEKEVEEHEPGKKPKKKTITAMEYLYEADLEDSYKASILKAFTKTVEEGRFPFVILDAPNVLLEDFRPFLLAAQRTGYEVYVLKPLDTDPDVCFKRNVHQRDAESIADLAALFEATPRIYTQLLVDSLFDLPKPPQDNEEEGIEEVDMEDEQDESGPAGEPQIRSRWAALEEEEGEPEEDQPKKKRRKKEDLAAGNPEEGANSTPNGKVTRKSGGPSILRKPGSAAAGKSVRWADEAAATQSEDAEGFTIGGRSAAQQLAQVHYVEGLGPGIDHHLQAGTFQEHAKEDRKSEGKTFRDILFGGSHV